MALTQRITIRLSRPEYDLIMRHCLEEDMTYSQLFIEAIRPQIKDLPPRIYWCSGAQAQRALATFHETLDFYKDFYKEIEE